MFSTWLKTNFSKDAIAVLGKSAEHAATHWYKKAPNTSKYKSELLKLAELCEILAPVKLQTRTKHAPLLTKIVEDVSEAEPKILAAMPKDVAWILGVSLTYIGPKFIQRQDADIRKELTTLASIFVTVGCGHDSVNLELIAVPHNK